MQLKITNSEVQELLSGIEIKYPKYATQIMNLANQNSQGTRARYVGQMSDLIQEFEGRSLNEWEEWYLEKHPDSIGIAVDRVYKMIQNFQEIIHRIDKEMVYNWIHELVIIKTYTGLRYQEAILKKVSENMKMKYRLSNAFEESKGIDGFIGEQPISIKPITYKTKMGLNEFIDHPIIYYKKRKNDIIIEYDLSEFTF